MPTESIENYLKTIYILQENCGEGDRVNTKQIAEKLGFSQASVSGMLQALSEDDYVKYARYRGVRLSEKGVSEAVKVLRKHRLVERLLVETFNYTWDEVHEEAEALEHAISDRLAERIDHYLGHPAYDPHGAPIPGMDGVFPERKVMVLADAEPGTVGELARVYSEEGDLLRILKNRGIEIGSRIFVLSVQKYDGQMRVMVNGEEEVTLSEKIVSNLFIVKS